MGVRGPRSEAEEEEEEDDEEEEGGCGPSREEEGEAAYPRRMSKHSRAAQAAPSE